jgi:hypothetical protein
MSDFNLNITELQKKIDNPLNILKKIIDEKRNQIEQNSYSLPLARVSDQKKLAVLEPIVMMFKKIEDRLDLLEKKN